ncbi:Werner Syndrome-like exonuclease isoform X2 [Cimex lectularius]|uniref:3'-5' exonuclease n=1 Tax=Cimex lectularius TaxID=79782 RepID=A0A8I6S6P6_CIMLE|nr:Werner Syndrome-like exonuclease isoform X2 [Cimex lectularius]
MDKSLSLPEWMLKVKAKSEEENSLISSQTEIYHIASESEQILELLDRFEGDYKIISLDLDWPSKISNVLAKSTRMHLCIGSSACLVFSIKNITSLPIAFLSVLKHPKVKLIGNNIVNDLLKLKQDFNIDVEHILNKNIQLTNWDRESLSCKHNWSLDNNLSITVDHEPKIPDDVENEIMTYGGKIIFCNNFYDCAIASEKLLNMAEEKEKFVIGFDLEWPFSRYTGRGKVALMQLCPNPDECFLFHVSEFTSLPKALVIFLKRKNVFLTGVNIKHDLKKLGTDFKFDVTSIIENNLIELNTFANQTLKCSQNWSLARLVLHLLNQTLLKTSVRTSNWASRQLTKEQISYAATDAYASFLCYKTLQDKLR